MKKEDAQLIKSIVDSSVGSLKKDLSGELKSSITRSLQEFKLSIRKEVRSDTLQLIADNNRILVDLLRQDMRAMEQRIIDTFNNFVSDSILPQIDDLDYRVTGLEKWAKI